MIYVLLFPFFQRTFGVFTNPFDPSYRPEPEGFVSIGDAKVRAFIVSFQIFSRIFRRFFRRSVPEIFRRTDPFLKWVAKVLVFANSTKFFFRLFLSSLPGWTTPKSLKFPKNFCFKLPAAFQPNNQHPFFLKRTAKIQRVFLPPKFFCKELSAFSLHLPTLFLASLCAVSKRVAKICPYTLLPNNFCQ